MRHSGHLFRRRAVRLAPVLALAVLLPAVAWAAAPAEVTGLRLGRHAGFLRLVFDLTAPPDYTARATGPRAFEISLPGAALPAEGHAALAANPLAPDIVVRPLARGGPLAFRVASRHDAFIRRAFVLGPPAGGAASEPAPWRLVLDIVPTAGHRPSPAAVAEAGPLPPPHGIDGLGSSAAATAAPAGGPAAEVAAEETPPRHVEVSWARASRILRELQARRDPAADAPVPPPLVLPPRYRDQPAVPLR